MPFADYTYGLRQSGTDWRGACPFCGSSDGFSITEEGRTGAYQCFSCGASGDAISYLMDAHGFDFHRACQVLGREPSSSRSSFASTRHRTAHSQASKRCKLSKQKYVEIERLKGQMTDDEKEQWRDIIRYPERIMRANGYGYVETLEGEELEGYLAHVEIQAEWAEDFLAQVSRRVQDEMYKIDKMDTAADFHSQEEDEE